MLQRIKNTKFKTISFVLKKQEFSMRGLLSHTFRTSALSLSAIILLGTAPSAFAQQGVGNCGFFMGRGWLGWIFGPLAMLIFLVVAVAAVILIIRALSGNNSGVSFQPPGHSGSPVDILQERFAKGEIDKKEYEERRKVLSM